MSIKIVVAASVALLTFIASDLSAQAAGRWSSPYYGGYGMHGPRYGYGYGYAASGYGAAWVPASAYYGYYWGPTSRPGLYGGGF
jgi:hypothetical protein